MHFHLPKRLHSWREFVGEIGIFVIGVLIASPSYADGAGDAKLAFAALNKGDNDSCLRLYTQALASGELDPLGQANAHLNRGVCNDRRRHILDSLADNKAAIDLYSSVTAAGHPASDRAEALLGRGITYYNLGKLDLARADFDAALTLTPSSGELRRNRGDLYRRQQKYADAISEYDAALKANPDDVAALDGRGLTRWLQNQPDAALTDLNAAIRLSADYADAYADRARVYSAQSDYLHAIADNTTFIRLRPDEASGYERRATAYRITKAYDDAVEDYSKLIEIDPDSASLHYFQRGVTYSEAGEDKRAIADLTAAINLDAKWSASYFSRAGLYLRNGLIDESLADYGAGFANLTSSRDYLDYMGRGQAEFAAGRFKEATRDFRQASDIMRSEFKADMSPTSLLWAHLAARRAGEDDHAYFAARAAKLGRAYWPGPILSYFLGEVQQDAIWKAAAAGDAIDRKSKECEADIYVGVAAFAEGNIDAAQDSLDAAISHCAPNSIMQVIAKAERGRMETKRQ